MKLLASVVFSSSMIVFSLAEQVVAHSGGTDRYGCHAGSRPRHCHGGGGSGGGLTGGGGSIGGGGSTGGGLTGGGGSTGGGLTGGGGSTGGGLTGGGGSTGSHGTQGSRYDDALIAIAVLGGMAVTLWGIYVIVSISKDNMSALDKINNDTYLPEPMQKEKFYLSSVVGKNWGLGLTMRL